MKVVAALKKLSAIIVLSILLAGVVFPGPVWARTEARYEGIIGSTIFGNDLGFTTSKQNLYHQQTLNTVDLEQYRMDFSPYASSIDSGSTQETPSTSTLSFGQVDLALPALSERSYQEYSATSTGFYNATFLGIPPINNAGAPVTLGSISPVAPPSDLVGSNMMFPEMYNIIPGYDRSKAAKATNMSSTIKNMTDLESTMGSGQSSGSTAAGVHETISGQELTGAETSVPLNYTGRNVTNQNLSYPYFTFNAKAATISNMSLLDRMWRDSHLGTMGRAYEGDTSYPEWILPTENTKSAIAMANWTAVNNLALNQTKPGTTLMPRFWDLGIT